MLKLSSIREKVISYRTLLGNISYLSILEVIGFISPLITYPYLMRVLGADLYAAIVLAQAVVAYVVIMINFGFNVSATKDVSENRFDVLELRTIFSSIIYLKFLISLFAIALAICVLYLINFKYVDIFILLLGLCVQEVFFPIWFFQGIEQMRYITIVSFISRLLFIVLVFFVVKTKSDYIFVPLAYSIGGIVTSLFSLWIIYKRFNVFFIRIKWNVMMADLKKSIPFFTSRLSTVVMERTNVLLIGYYFDLTTVAVYDLATKVISIIKTPFTIVSQALYPHVVRTKNMRFVRKVCFLVLAVGLLSAILLDSFSHVIVLFLGGKELVQAIPILSVMAWYLPIVASSYILGASTLVVQGFVKAYNFSVLYSFILYVAIVLFLVYWNVINVYTMTLAYIAPELFVLLYRGRIVLKYKLLS